MVADLRRQENPRMRPQLDLVQVLKDVLLEIIEDSDKLTPEHKASLQKRLNDIGKQPEQPPEPEQPPRVQVLIDEALKKLAILKDIHPREEERRGILESLLVQAEIEKLTATHDLAWAKAVLERRGRIGNLGWDLDNYRYVENNGKVRSSRTVSSWDSVELWYKEASAFPGLHDGWYERFEP